MQSWVELAQRAKAFATRRMKLVPRLLHTSLIEEQILAYIYTSGHDLRAVPDPSREAPLTDNGRFPAPEAVRAVERLARIGLLRRSEPNFSTQTGEAGRLARLNGYGLTDFAVSELTLALPQVTELQVAV